MPIPYLVRRELDIFNRELQEDYMIYGVAIHEQHIRKWWNPFRYLVGPIKYRRIPHNKLYIQTRKP